MASGGAAAPAPRRPYTYKLPPPRTVEALCVGVHTTLEAFSGAGEAPGARGSYKAILGENRVTPERVDSEGTRSSRRA